MGPPSTLFLTTLVSGGSRNFERWFPLVVDHRHRGLWVQPPAAEEVLMFKSIQSIESYITFYTLDHYQCHIQ